MEKIFIYYPSHITGGAEFLLKTVADFLKKHVEVHLIDIEDGWLSKNLHDVKKIKITNNLKIKLDEHSVLITTANLIRKLDEHFTGNFKIIAWIVQINNVIPSLPRIGSIQYIPILRKLLKVTLLRSEYKNLSSLTSYLHNKNSLYTMDDACNDVFEKYYGWRVKNYLPVILPSNKIFDLPTQKKRRPTNYFRCVWLGRLDGQFKNPILKRVMLDLSNHAKNSDDHITFTIIGTGPGLSEAKNVASKIKNMEVFFLGELRGTELFNVLCGHDIGFAMGTSALEIAACGTPVILLDASYREVASSYKYQWLFESRGYCIGRSIDNAVDKSMGNKRDINDVLEDITNSEDSIRYLCHAHVRKFHTIESLESRILDAIKQTTSDFQFMRESGLLKKPYWYYFRKI